MSQQQTISVNAVDHQTWSSIAPSFADYNYEQSYEYATAAASRLGASALFLTIEEGESLLGATSVRIKTIPLLGKGIAYISGGPIIQENLKGSWSERKLKLVIAALKKKLVDEAGHILRLRLPLLPPAPQFDFDTMFAELDFQRTDRARAYKTIAIDVKQDMEGLRRNFHGKWRTDLRYAEKSELSIQHGSTADLFSRFSALFDQMRTTKEFDVSLTPDFYFALPENSVGLEVIIAQKDGQDAAGHVISMLGDSVIYLFGATNNIGRKTKAGYLLNWSAMQLAKKRGFSWYDLGGIDVVANPDGYRFKARMGGKEMDAAGPYEVRPDGFVAPIIETLETFRGRLKRL